MLTTPEPTPDGFDPLVFWELHKTKIVLYVALLIVGLIAFSSYQISAHKKLAESQEMFGKAKTLEDYNQIIQKFPLTNAAGNAHLLMSELQRKEGKYDDAIATLRKFIDQYPEHPLISGGWVSLGATLTAHGKIDEALDAYQQVTSKYPDSYNAPLAMFSRANLLKNQGKMDEAKRMFENLISQFPASGFSQEATHELRLLKNKAQG